MPFKDATKRKEYARKYSRKHRLKNLDNYRKYQREWHRLWRAKNREKSREDDRTYYQENRVRLIANRKKTKEKYIARYVTGNAIKGGRLQRPSKCERCHTICKPEAHHHKGYEKEHHLDVIFLCRNCHENEHLISQTSTGLERR